MLNFKVSDSGIPVYHYQMDDAAICKVMIVANCGSAHEDSDSYGVAHFLEHLCFQGTPTKNKHQVSREQALIGSYNAYTNYFETAYHFDSLNEDFERGFQALKEAVFDSNYPEQEFEKEKSVIIEEWRMYDNYPDEHFWNFVLDKCFDQKESHPIIGTENSIRQMNPEKLHRFRNKWYGRENMFVVVVGNLEFNRVMEAVNNILPPAKSVEKVGICLNDFNCTESKYLMETDRFEQAAFGLIFKGTTPKDNFLKSYKPTFFSYALSKYLYEYIRDDLGLCYGVSVGGFSNYENVFSTVSMLTNNNYLEKAEFELENIFNQIKAEGFPTELFEICKKQQLYNKVKTLQTVSGIANTIVAGVKGSSDPDWFINEGHKMLDIEQMKKFASELKPSDLQEIAQSKLNGFTKFSMVSTKN